MSLLLFKVSGDHALEWMRCELSCGHLFVDEINVEVADHRFRFVLASSARVRVHNYRVIDLQIHLDDISEAFGLLRDTNTAYIRRKQFVPRRDIDAVMLHAISNCPINGPLELSIPPIQPFSVDYYSSAQERDEMADEFRRTPMDDQIEYLMHTINIPLEVAAAPVTLKDGQLVATATIPSDTIVAAIAPDVVQVFPTAGVVPEGLESFAAKFAGAVMVTRSDVPPIDPQDLDESRRVPLTPYLHIFPAIDPPHKTMLGYAVVCREGNANVRLEINGPAAYYRTTQEIAEGEILFKC